MSGALMVTAGTFVSSSAAPPTPFDFINPPQLVSASFDGTTQSFLAPSSSTNAAFTLAGDFTVEGWYYPTNITGVHSLFTLGTETTNRYTWLLNGAAINSNLYGNTSVAYTGSLSINTWYHIAVVRSGSTVTLYVNGTANATTDTQAGTIGNGVLRIGADGSGVTRVAGRMSNFRIAASAVYSGATITTPTKPLSLTSAAFYMSMGVSPFIDYSTNAVAVTNTGTIALVNFSPFSTSWTDSISAIAATVATGINSTNNPTYDARYGGGLNILSTALTYVDVPTTYGGAGPFTISMAAVLPVAQGSHYVAIFDGACAVNDRAGQYINARNWVGDGLEVGGQGVWAASNSTTVPAMATLAWWDFVFNGRNIAVYKNGTAVTMSGSDMGAGNANTGWKNPLRFCGDDSIAAGNMMWDGAVYRIKCQAGALSSGAITTQFNAVRATYGL